MFIAFFVFLVGLVFAPMTLMGEGAAPINAPSASAVVVEGAVILAEGQVNAVSIFPEPESADYPDCYYTAHVTLNSILAGDPIERNIVLVIPAFIDLKKSAFTDVAKGERRSLKMVRFADLPEAMQSIQIADDIGAFDLEYFYVIETEVIEEFTMGEFTVPFASGNVYESPFDKPAAVGVSAKAAAAQKEFIRRELEYVNSRLAALPKDLSELDAHHKAVWSARQKEFTITPGYFAWGKVGKAWLGNYINQPLIGKRKLNTRTIESIASLNDFLEVKGVQLIVQIIPKHHVVSTRYINEEFRDVVDYESAIAAKALLEAGVETMFTSDEMIKRLGDYELSFFYPRDHHLAEGAIDVMTDLLLPRMERFDLTPDLDPQKFTVTRQQGVYAESGTMLPALEAGDEQFRENIYSITAPEVRYEGQCLQPNPDSQVIILGNSFANTPSKYSSYSIYFAKKTNYNPALMISFGPGLFNTLPRRLFDMSDVYLEGKRVAIFIVGSDFLYRNIVCLNLHELDRESRILQNRSLIGEMAVVGGVEEETAKEMARRQSRTRQLDWERFISIATSTKFTFETKGESATVLELDDLGKRFDVSREIVAVVSAASMPPTLAQVEVNGEVRDIPNFVQAQWQRMLFILPPGSETLQIRLLSGGKESLVAMQNVLLYQ